MDAHPMDGMGHPQDEFSAHEDWHDDGQAMHQLMQERQERATEILRQLYQHEIYYEPAGDVSEEDLRFLCAELGLDWQDITR